MVQVEYTKEKGLVQKSGSASFTIPSDITIGHPVNQTVTGNTIATVNFAGILHRANPADAADQINLSGKHMSFHTAAGDQFYVYFDPGNAGADDPAPGGTGIEVIAADGALETPEKIVNELVAALNANNDWNTEFLAIAQGESIKIVSLRMGEAGGIVSLGTLSNMVAGDGTTSYDPVSPVLATVQGAGSHIINGLGFSKVEDAEQSVGAGGANESFVVVKNLEANKNHGTQKIIASKLPHDVEVYNEAKTGVALGTLAAGSPILHLVWNGTEWKNIGN